MLTYSIAIRTLGTAGNKFLQELKSIYTQTIQPERVLVYIADGYDRPVDTIGREEYIWVRKGMISQRARRYDEISSDCILLLDDDVQLAPDSVEKMLRAMEEKEADCIGADVFQNHLLPLKTKLFAAVTNLVFPHWSRIWAFKIHRNGSFSYNNRPNRSFYWSQSCGGPAVLCRKDSFLRFHFDDEAWLDSFGFSYGDDALLFNKLFRNGGRLGILFDSGVTNLDAKTSSDSFRNSSRYIYLRTKALLMIWWRSCFRNGKDTVWSRLLAAIAFGFKTLWLIPIMCTASLAKWDRRYVGSYFNGLRDGWKEVHSTAFLNLPPYIR